MKNSIAAHPPVSTGMSIVAALPRAPGLLLCIAVAAAAIGVERVETLLFGRAWLEALVLAIVIGTAVRSLAPLPAAVEPGVRFGARTLLEVAVVLLGASVSAAAVIAAGPALLLAIVAVVVLATLASVAIGRLLGLPPRMAILVACGNSICGNSAIAAVAPVIDADGDDVAAAIAFTAVLGVGMVLALPLLAALLKLGVVAGGAFAGLTVYAVPQVIAAAAPLGAGAVQAGMLVKLMRVLMLGPVCLVLAAVNRRLPPAPRAAAAPGRPSLRQLVPWFVLGFVALMALRSLGVLPPLLVAAAGDAATGLTIVAMAALGLGVELRSVARAGARVTLAVVLSLLVLGAISLVAIRLLGL